MIEYRPEGAQPLRFRGPLSTAYSWFLKRVTSDEVIRGLVKGYESVPHPVEARALLFIPRMTPWLYFGMSKVAEEYIGTGRRGAPTLGRAMDVEIVAVVAGSDPADCLKIWDAIHHAIGSRTAEAMRSMWDAGVSGMTPILGPNDIEAPAKDFDPKHIAAAGIVRVLV